MAERKINSARLYKTEANLVTSSKSNPEEFKDFLFNENLEKTALILMSSGNYGGLDFEEVTRFASVL